MQIDQLALMLTIQADRQRVKREIAANQIGVDGPAGDVGQRAGMRVSFRAGSCQIDRREAGAARKEQLRRAKPLELFPRTA